MGGVGYRLAAKLLLFLLLLAAWFVRRAIPLRLNTAVPARLPNQHVKLSLLHAYALTLVLTTALCQF